jgi:hypothetical protein
MEKEYIYLLYENIDDLCDIRRHLVAPAYKDKDQADLACMQAEEENTDELTFFNVDRCEIN